MADLFRYAAFISYSSKDAVFARRLHRALERFGIPSSLGKFDLIGGGKKNRVYPIFRDREELSAGELGDLIESALKASGALIVVCSPNSAASQWVQKEIEFFVRLGRQDRMFAIIAASAPLLNEHGTDLTRDSFPPAFRLNALEPVAADARKGQDGFRNAWLKIVAGLIGVTPGQIIDRDRKRRRIHAIRNWAVALAVVGLVGGVWQFGASRRDAALRAENMRAAQLFAEQSVQAKATHDNNLAIYYAAQSLLHSSLSGSAPVDLDFFSSLSPAAGQIFSTRISQSVDHWAVSPSRRLLASWTTGSPIALFNLDTGTRARSVNIAGRRITAMTFIDDHRLAIGDAGGLVAIFDTDTGKPTASEAVAEEAIVAMATENASNQTFAATAHTVFKVNASTLRSTPFFGYQGGTIERLAINSNGREIAIVSSDHSIRVVSLASNATKASLEYQQAPRAIVMAPLRKQTFVSTWDRVIHVLTGDSRVEIEALQSPGSAIETMDVSSDGRLLATGDRDGAAYLWDTDSGQVLEHLGSRGAHVELVTFSLDGATLFVFDKGGLLRAWRLRPRLNERTIKAHDGAVRGVSCLPGDSGLVASVGDDGMVRVWNTSAGTLVSEQDAQIHQITASALSPDGTVLATGGSGGTIALWRTPNLRRRNQFNAHEGRVAALDFSVDGRYLISAGWDGTIGIWDVASDTLVRRIKVSDKELTGVTASSGGRLVASTGLDGQLRLFQLADGQNVAHYGISDGFLRVGRFNKNGSALAIAGKDGIVRLFSPPLFNNPIPLVGQSQPIWSLAFDPSGKFLVAGSRSDGDSQTLRVWDVAKRRLVARPEGHFGFTLTTCFSSSGDQLVTGGNEGLIKTWNLQRILKAANAQRESLESRLQQLALHPETPSSKKYKALIDASAAQSGQFQQAPKTPW